MKKTYEQYIQLLVTKQKCLTKNKQPQRHSKKPEREREEEKGTFQKHSKHLTTGDVMKTETKTKEQYFPLKAEIK